MAKHYTAFQQQAIQANGTDICVAAGAGSGKTGVLVERFVRLITQSRDGLLPPEQRARVDEILVITFTEKATKEMKTRIVGELTRLGLIEERRQVETAYISTIHGFCSRLLQENPFEAGVDPQFKVLDENQARRLLRQCIEDVVARAYDIDNAETTELIASTQGEREYGGDNADGLATLAGSVETTLAKLRGAGVTGKQLTQHCQQGLDGTTEQSLEPVWAILTPILLEINACIEALADLRRSVTGALELACRGVLEQAALLCPRAAPLPDTLAAMQTTMQAASRARLRSGNAPLQEMQAANLLIRIKIACEEARALYGIVGEREEDAARSCHRLWRLTLHVWRAYETAKRRRGVLDSDDLQAQAVRLLEKSPNVRLRYQRRFRHLMIDEFQDTNPMQMRLVELLHNATNFLFVVGDVQQSIYGFRHADSTLFRSLERKFREEGAGLHVPLSVNFRSRPEILQLVEHVFGQVWRGARTPFVPLSCGAPFDAKPTPSIELLLTQDMGRRDYVRLEADALAARIQRLVEGEELTLTSHLDPRCGQPVGYRDIAILLRGLTDIQKYEEAFARRGVPFFVVGGGRGYYARHEIRDLRNVLTVLDTPLDDVALAATLRSPLVGADVDTLYRLSLSARSNPDEDKGAEKGTRRKSRALPLYPALLDLLARGELPDEETAKLTEFVVIMEDLRTQEDRLPVGHLLERLITRTHYDARLLCRPGGRRRLANVRKLLQMANSESVLGVRDFIRRLRELEKLSDREGDAPTEEEASDVVRFLTIHGAKGLEFPVVVLADLARSQSYPERGQFVCDPQLMAIGTKLGGEPNIVYKAIDARRREADIEEANRLLYVAMTRAREHLILCGNVGRNWGVNWADKLFPLLGILDAPPEPEQAVLLGGIPATRAPLSHYVHAPITGTPCSPALARRDARKQADDIALAILNGTFDAPQI